MSQRYQNGSVNRLPVLPGSLTSSQTKIARWTTTRMRAKTMPTSLMFLLLLFAVLTVSSFIWGASKVRGNDLKVGPLKSEHNNFLLLKYDYNGCRNTTHNEGRDLAFMNLENTIFLKGFQTSQSIKRGYPNDSLKTNQNKLFAGEYWATISLQW